MIKAWLAERGIDVFDPYEIVADWLRARGYEGLYYADGFEGCGCTLDDLMPCAGRGIDMIADACSDCHPGYRFDCLRCAKRGTEDCPLGDECDLVIGSKDCCEPDYRDPEPALAAASASAAESASSPVLKDDPAESPQLRAAKEALADRFRRDLYGDLFNPAV